MSIRLKTLAGFYQHSHSIWDIGCDHGILGLSFVDRDSVKSIHLVDPSIDVINVLKKKLIDSYITKSHLIKVLHQKGQEIILNPESKTIFVAGMGGKEIEQIVQNLIPQMRRDDLLVLSPHRNILELRRSLHHSELGLMKEISLKEDGQFYQIICLSKSEDLPKTPLYGENVWRGEVGEEYREHLKQTFKHHQDPLSKAFVEFLNSFI